MKKYKKDAEEMLKEATLSESWGNPRNKRVYALMVDEEIIGYIKKKVDINKIKLGKVHTTWRGKKVELLYDDEQVGFLWD